MPEPIEDQTGLWVSASMAMRYRSQGIPEGRGGYRYFRKPIEPNELLATVEAALR